MSYTNQFGQKIIADEVVIRLTQDELKNSVRFLIRQITGTYANVNVAVHPELDTENVFIELEDNDEDTLDELYKNEFSIDSPEDDTNMLMGLLFDESVWYAVDVEGMIEVRMPLATYMKRTFDY